VLDHSSACCSDDMAEMIPIKDVNTMITFPKSPDVNPACGIAMPALTHSHDEGFSLIESLMAVLVLALGFMFVGPMMVNSTKSTSLARSKDTAGLAAALRLETLAALYKADPSHSDLTLGTHTPIVVEVTNPGDSSKVNRYNVEWTVGNVPDSRAGKVLKAVQVTATATPIGSGTATNVKVGQNKVVHITTIFSLRSS
jgi:prepilin-type N-terminal cleavage/methylation domain-containing protein